MSLVVVNAYMLGFIAAVCGYLERQPLLPRHGYPCSYSDLVAVRIGANI